MPDSHCLYFRIKIHNAMLVQSGMAGGKFFFTNQIKKGFLSRWSSFKIGLHGIHRPGFLPAGCEVRGIKLH